MSFEPVEGSLRYLGDYSGPSKNHLSERERIGLLSRDAKHQVLACGAMGFYGLH
jgi:hypothetical protein